MSNTKHKPELSDPFHIIALLDGVSPSDFSLLPTATIAPVHQQNDDSVSRLPILSNLINLPCEPIYVLAVNARTFADSQL
jgi:hypothetical protein